MKLEYVNRNSYVYLFAWGIAGVAFAFVLPWLDNLSDNGTAADQSKAVEKKQSNRTLAIRSIGAFVGIAFAMVCFFPYVSMAWGNVCTDNRSADSHGNQPRRNLLLSPS